MTEHARAAAQWGRIGFQCVLCRCKYAVQPWVRPYLCLHSSPWPSFQRSSTEVQINAQSLRLLVLSWSQKLRGENEQLWFPSLSHLCQTKDWILKESKKKSDRWNASNKMEGKLQVNPQGAFNIHANAPVGLDRASLCWNSSLFWVWLYLKFIFGLLPAGLFS